MPRASWGDVGARPFEEDLDEYDVYEGEQPPKGVYRVRMKTLRLKTNKNNEPMLNGLLVIVEPKSSPKSQYNGYAFWFNLNVTKQGTKWVNNFLSVLVPDAKQREFRKAFWDQKVMLDKEEPPNIVSIGTWKFANNDVIVKANCKFSPAKGDYDEKLDVLRFLKDDGTKTDEEEDADEAAESEEDWEAEEGAESDEAEEEDDEEDDEEVAEREEELSELTTVELKKILKGHGFKIASYKGKDDDALIDMILDHEFPEDEEDEEPEPEPEPEPESEKPTRRRRVVAKPAAAAEEEPAKPAAATTGRKRRARGEPPF